MSIDRRTFLVTAGTLVAAAACPQLASAQTRRISIGTNPTGTDYYVIGGGLAKLLTDKLETPAIVQPYAGSSVYLPLVQGGEVTMGISTSIDSGGAYQGDLGRSPMRKLRAVMRLWPLPYAMVVRRDSPVRTIADLKGKRVIVNFKANASLAAVNKAMLAVGGLKETDVDGLNVTGLPQGLQAVVEGNADATFAAVGIPILREAHASVGIRYVGLTGPNATEEFLGNLVPGVYPLPIDPAPNLPEVTERTIITGIDVFLITSSDVPSETVSRVAQTIYEGFAGLQQDYATLRRSAQGEVARASNTVPYHPGAVDFFRRAGLWTPRNEQREAQFAKS